MKDTTGKRERQIIIITILILTTVIKLVDINKIYRTNEIETVALEDVNLTVNKGEFLSIMGPSGCGKSTLLNIMGLLDTPTGGSIEVAGTRIESMKDKELAAFRNKKLGFVFQSFHLINSLNVLDNVELPLLYRRMSSSERKRLAQDVLAKVGLSHRMRHFPSQLSGGQCQRVAIARAIIGNPEIILAGRRMNDGMGEYVATETVKHMLKKGIQVLNSEIIILGFTFKENCPDVRNTKVIDIYRTLKEYNANVTIYDPWANPAIAKHEYGIEVVNELPKEKFDAAIVAVAHKAFEGMDMLALLKEKHVVFDVKCTLNRNIIDARL